MNIGDEVTFHITGVVPLYKGVITIVAGHAGYPEIMVTHVRVPDGWIPSGEWPILKDGDYILA